MIKNSLLVFFRKIKKYDIYSLINLFGLSIGITACLLIFLYMADEFRFDRHNRDAQDIYRLLQYNPRTGSDFAMQPAVMYPYLEGQIPEVQTFGRLLMLPEIVINADGKPFSESEFMMADPTVLDIFDFQFIAGDPATALSNPHSLIITRTAAEKYFGDDDPMGKSLVFLNMFTFEVSGVIEALPKNSHFRFAMLGAVDSFESIDPSLLTSWENLGFYYYFKLRPAADTEAVSSMIRSIVMNANDGFNQESYYHLQPLLDIRLHSGSVEWELADIGSITVVRVFSVVALLILILACFNFVNLSVATSIKRAREIGVKKVLGVSRKQLVFQFIAETFIISFFALLLSLLLVELSLPLLNSLSGKSLSFGLFSDPLMILVLAGLLLIISVIAGAYPAMIISRFKAIEAMKGLQTLTSIKTGKQKIFRLGLRQILMVLQFAVSTALIISTVLIFMQMQFLSQRHPGYDREGLIAVSNYVDEQGQSRALWLKEYLQRHPDVVSVSLSHNLPPARISNYAGLFYDTDIGRQSFHSAIVSCDADYFTTLGSRIISGRDFSDAMATDAAETAIINVTAASRMDVDDPLDMMIGGFYDGQRRRVIGVVEDIHFSSLHEAVGPVVFYISEESYPQNSKNILVRAAPGTEPAVVAHLAELWQQETTQWPLIYRFVEEQFMEDYHDDKSVMRILASFAALAIVLSIMGLVGLAVYTAATRTKEIGIRRVLGGSVAGIIRLISTEFGVLVILSNIFAWPAAYLFVNRWLDNFAYQLDINLTVFILAAVLVIFLSLLIVAAITYRTATANPVESMRSADQ